MRINAIDNYYNSNKYNKKPSFGTLIKDNSVLPIINNMSKPDKLEFEQIEKRIAKTKFWDMKISSIGDKFKEFTYSFLNKNPKEGVITGGIYPYNILKNKIKFYTIIYGPENTTFNTIDTLTFKSPERAKELLDKYVENNFFAISRRYNLTPLETLKMKEVELEMLEEASENIREKHNMTKIETEVKTKSTIGNNFNFKD